MLMDLPGHSDYHKFPTQRPTPADLSIWKTALHKLSSIFHVLTIKLQEYISPPHVLPHGCLTTLGRSFITIFCGATKCTMRCTYRLWTLWLAGPDLDNVLIWHALHMALPITNIMPVLLFLKRDRFSYTPWYLVSCLHGQFMVLNMWLKALQIKPYGFHLITMGRFLDSWWHAGTIPCDYPWWVIYEGIVSLHLLSSDYDILHYCKSSM